ncbi:MAG: AraC family transcriptional regulator [Bacteroidota bacterium]
MNTHTYVTTDLQASLSLSHYDPFLRCIYEIVQQNLENEQLSVAFLARKVHLSVSQLNRKLDKLAKVSAGKLIRTLRMNYAVRLLQTNKYSVEEIAYRIGYANSAHFCRGFKQHFGCTPSNYHAQKW